ncbi:hypothetical protein D5H75_36180 [Bailinhaonella thermotolerans]|uniref:Uncharacterized protein n=1 Tax=Bailinhaonella thermotolerans TaxID=1070861 RepID=A0A3A4A817_9ACTN|nr:hypothetical protein D5H75_36180 [Bailinhaonella thermotolerans]
MGRQVEYFRKRTRGGKGISTQALADRCADLGLPLDRSVIAKLEKGLRQTIAVGEVLVLAEALQVPPLLLILPIGNASTVEALPHVEISTTTAYDWFVGLEPGHRREEVAPESMRSDTWHASSKVARLMHEHQQQLTERERALAGASHQRRLAEHAAADRERRARLDAAEALAGSATLIEQGITRIRREMDLLGLNALPPLPPTLDHLDTASTGEHRTDNRELDVVPTKSE